MIGDMIGEPGGWPWSSVLPGSREEREIDFVTANGENVAGGMGLTVSTAEAMFTGGVDVITAAAITSGTSARSTPFSTPTTASCAR